MVGLRVPLNIPIGANVMAAWLIAALQMLRGLAIGTPTRALISGGTAGAVGAGQGLFDFLPGIGGGGDDRVRRRRRRRALTQSDRNDIAFIAATIGKAAAGSFAVQLATRSR